MKRVFILLPFLDLLGFSVLGQNPLRTIASVQAYRHLPDKQKLVLLTDSVPDIKMDLVYATDQNFTHTQLYHHPRLLVVRPLATALKSAAEKLRTRGIGLLVFDAYRPYSVSKKMWETVHDNRYVADPVHGSDHNRGAAVDLSLYELKTGIPLEMPTGFDDFTEKAHLSYRPRSGTILANRNLLQRTMEAVGLSPLSTEWWHFSLPDSKEFEVLDLGFEYF